MAVSVSSHGTGALSIGEVARRAGIRRSAIRYYESVGVLPAPERVSGQRRYDDSVLHRLAVIETGQSVGLSLEDIRKLLQASEDGGVGAHLKSLAEQKLPEVETLILQAQTVKRWLEAAKACECPELGDCPLFDGAITVPSER